MACTRPCAKVVCQIPGDSDCFGCLIPRVSLLLPTPLPLGENIDRCMMIESDEKTIHMKFLKNQPE